MIGDGVIRPALHYRYRNSYGAIGTDVAIESSDIALMADDMMMVSETFGLSKRTYGIIKQNIWPRSYRERCWCFIIQRDFISTAGRLFITYLQYLLY